MREPVNRGPSTTAKAGILSIAFLTGIVPGAILGIVPGLIAGFFSVHLIAAVILCALYGVGYIWQRRVNFGDVSVVSYLLAFGSGIGMAASVGGIGALVVAIRG